MTPEQIKSKFRREGKTFTEWAAEHGYPRNEVYKVLNGLCKARWGKGHEIAVRLGLKQAA